MLRRSNAVFAFAYKVWRFGTVTFSFFYFLEYRGTPSKKFVTDHRTTNTIQLFVAMKKIFLVCSSEQGAVKGNFPETT